MTPENWANLGAALAMTFAGWQAWKANRQTKNTGNGFAGHVKESLARIEIEQGVTRALLTEHLADHAGHDLR